MLGLAQEVDACVFELEGVLTGAAAIHAAAWAETFDELLLERGDGRYAPFNPRTDYERYIHGRPRVEGVRAFLASRGIRLPEGRPDDPPTAETVQGLARRKNLALLRRLATEGVKAHEGARHYLEAVRDAGLHAAVVSASANTATILDQAGLAGLVDVRIDGTTILAQPVTGSTSRRATRPRSRPCPPASPRDARPASARSSPSSATGGRRRCGAKAPTSSSATSASCSIQRFADYAAFAPAVTIACTWTGVSSEAATRQEDSASSAAALASLS
jgi:beta-phosphoglucomutase-like phosphatase (HAD superfamily)